MDIDDQDLYAVLDPIRWVADMGDFAAASAESLGRLLGAGKAVFIDRGTGGTAPSPDDVHFLHWPGWAKQHYCEHVRRRDPIGRWLAAVQARRAGDVARLSDLVPPGQMVRTRYFRELMQPSDAGHVLTLAVRQGAAVAGALSLVRGADAPDFGPREHALAQSLAPLLGLAYGIALERAGRGLAGGQQARNADCGPDCGVMAGLTPREREVAALVAAGHPNKEIARRLCTSHWTVKNQLRAIFSKLDVHSRTGLCARLGRAGAP
ncbi:LuxR C-terminal-related transcriptional regulator [Pseudorhodoferax sp. LjRoot39]|uniref:helix-turn-helix transcriptional regulator n=1 Tax=Pseudorhodoferax sp. LjRoot39 TaxID=3342328 RepID=UPI003ECC61C6